MPKKWKQYQGKSVFYCNGRCISGPDRKYFSVALFLFWGISILFYCFVAPWLVGDIPGPGIPILIIQILIFLLVSASFFICAYTDAGIIPRDQKKKLELENNPFSSPPKSQSIEINGTKYVKKFCDTCAIYRPLRATHCSTCNNCVRRFDHHCPWIGNCIGERNYNYFLWFIFGLSILSLYVILVCIAHLTYLTIESSHGGVLAFLAAVGNAPISLVIIVLGSVAFFLVTSLSIFHCHLLWLNVTTNEKVKKSYVRTPNPFYKGPIIYHSQVLFPNCSPTFLQAAREIDDEYT